jgi:hypothetical protein
VPRALQWCGVCGTCSESAPATPAAVAAAQWSGITAALAASASLDPAVAFEAVGVLWILAMDNDANSAAIRGGGGVELLTALADAGSGRSAAVRERARDAVVTLRAGR